MRYTSGDLRIYERIFTLVGTYSAVEQTIACDPCPIGRTCPQTGMNSTLICPSGHYCPGGSYGDGEPCPTGESAISGILISIFSIVVRPSKSM